jgi:high-affinity Fe2+/Pb2+ permease
VTDTELVCEYGSLFRSRKLTFPRDEVREVRREHGRAIKMAAGGAIAAAVGAGIGIAAQSKDSETRKYGAISGITLGVVVGLVVGRIFSERHGRVVYQR